MMKANCNGLAGLIFGHKFQSRFSYGEPTLASAEGRGRGISEMIEASKPATYECDVCERCGCIVRSDQVAKEQP